MKKLLAIFALFLSVQMVQASPLTLEKSKKADTELTEAQKVRAAEMQARLDEIKAMDFKSMTRDEKKEIRSELKDMRVEAKAAGSGIYISAGAIILILLLIIIL